MELGNDMQRDEMSSAKAGDGSRTHDVQLGKPATHFASADESSACKRGNPNPSTIPSSQAQNEGIDVRLQQIIDSWPSLPEAVRAGIVVMVEVASNS